MKRVVIGLSGGVDSSVAAHLLIEQGYEVIGIFMKNWHDESVLISDDCPWIEDSNDAMAVAEKLGIPFQTFDFSEQYKERIVDYMFKEYEQGRTPNPDVLCNREIKFDIFLDAAIKLNADYVATGHYCQKGEINTDSGTVFQLKAGADNNKDQSYFLCQLSQKQLSKALFPIGHLQKSEVRKIAAEQDLITADKKDSQGLCFIGKVRLPDFLQQQLKPKKGQIINVPNGLEQFNQHSEDSFDTKKDWLNHVSADYQYNTEIGIVVGEHQGAHYFTIGQRKGLGVGGFVEPLFVIETDTKENLIYVGESKIHGGLNRKALKITLEDIHWIRPDLTMNIGEERNYSLRIRYRQPLEKARLYMESDGLYIVFENPQSGVARGQFAAWYDGDELIGSGTIS